MKIVRIRSKALVFLIFFTLGILVLTRIAVFNNAIENLPAKLPEDLDIDKKRTDNEKDNGDKKFIKKDRKAFYPLNEANILKPQPPDPERTTNVTSVEDKNKAPSNNTPVNNANVSATQFRPPPGNLVNKNISQVNISQSPSPPQQVAAKKFIPQRRIVHLDLKGAPPQVHYFEKFFRFIRNLNATGVLIEWEDMFPYSGVLAGVRNAQAYSSSEVTQILQWAKQYELDVIPLVQTFGHLEWILKHAEFAKFREIDRYAQVICLSNPGALDLVKLAIDQVMELHKDYGEFFHMGADEAFQIGQCDKCQKTIREELGHSRDRLMLKHIASVATHIVVKHKKRVLMWHDMLSNADANVVKEFKLGDLVEPVVWAYAESLNEYLTPDLWSRFAANFPNVWGASAFKGADGPNRFYSNVQHYLQNHIAWTNQMNTHYKEFRGEFRGIILTGWQRFDHFALLCELLPVGIPSLAVNLLVVRNGEFDRTNVVREITQVMECGSHLFDINSQGIGGFCQFPGAKIYQFVQQFKLSQKNMRTQLLEDYQLRGWMSRFNIRHSYSSAWYLDQMVDKINMYFNELKNIASNLRTELSKVFFADTVDEFLYTYVNEDLELLSDLKLSALRIGNSSTFPLRPFQILNASSVDNLPKVVDDSKKVPKNG